MDTAAGGRKLPDINTPQNRHHTIKKIRQTMSTDLETALRAYEQMRPAVVLKAAELISGLKAIKQQIEGRAGALGYSARCQQAIEVCRGECCIWHFPKTLTAVDFFIAAFDLAAAERKVLVEQVRHPVKSSYQCPLLRKDGCIFAFQSRPIACTSAFPCMVGGEYWAYKESFRKDIDDIYAVIRHIINNRTCKRHP
jgi:hypothetical protein